MVSDHLRGMVVEPSFLELASPSIAQGVARLAARQVRRVQVFPLLLFAAGHVKRDIPRAVAEAASRDPRLVFEVLPPLGCHPAIVRLAARRFRAAVMDSRTPSVTSDPGSESDTLLLLAGRGSSDSDAIAEMTRFSQQLAHCVGAGRVSTCFCAVAQPPLAHALKQAGEDRFLRIVVQPHLLFAGDVLRQVRESVAEAACEFPHRQWLVAEHLGAEEVVAKCVAELVTGKVESG